MLFQALAEHRARRREAWASVKRVGIAWRLTNRQISHATAPARDPPTINKTFLNQLLNPLGTEVATFSLADLGHSRRETGVMKSNERGEECRCVRLGKAWLLYC